MEGGKDGKKRSSEGGGLEKVFDWVGGWVEAEGGVEVGSGWVGGWAVGR